MVLMHYGAMSESLEKPAADYDPAGEVTEICRDLIRIDTTNFGDQPGPGERKAAEHVATLLDEVGIETELWEAEPGRTNVLARWGGRPVTPCWCMATSTSYPPTPTTGSCTPSAARSTMVRYGAVAPWT